MIVNLEDQLLKVGAHLWESIGFLGLVRCSH